MKLAFFIHGLSGGGAERVMSIVANGLATRGHDVHIVMVYSSKEPVFEINPDVKVDSISYNWERIKNKFFRAIYCKIFCFHHIRRITKEIKPDIAITFLSALNPIIIFSLLGLRVPVIASEHTTVTRKEPFSVWFPRMLMYPFADAITVLTQRDYNLWKKKYKQLYYLPNPRVPSPKIEGKERKKIILAVGRVMGWKVKGFDTLINCWYGIKDRFPDWSCEIAGDYNQEAIVALQKELIPGALDCVHFLGFRSDVRELMRESEVFCLTSRVEGFGMVLLEAMDAGCCCVSFDVPSGPGEIIDDNVSGFLVKNQNIDDLKEKLSIVMSDSELRQRFSEAAPKSIEKYNVEHILNRWEALIISLRNGNGIPE